MSYKNLDEMTHEYLLKLIEVHRDDWNKYTPDELAKRAAMYAKSLKEVLRNA